MSVSEQAGTSKEEYEQIAMFRYVLRRFLHFSENAVRSVGLTPHHHEALLAIQGFPGRDYVNMGELAERLQVKHNAAVGLVDRLAAEGFVVRSAVESDRRQVHVSLTAQGKRLLAELSAVHREELKTIAPELIVQLTRLTEWHKLRRL